MINAIHAVVYTKQADAVRNFFRDVLNFPAVDAGHGWLIFGLPPAELGIHPTDSDNESGRHQLYLMCDDIHATVSDLQRKGVKFTQEVKDVGWGLLTAMEIPGGDSLSLYQPKHASPLNPGRPLA